MIDAILDIQLRDPIFIDVLRLSATKIRVFFAQKRVYSLEGVIHHEFGVCHEKWTVYPTRSSYGNRIVSLQRICGDLAYICDDGYAYSLADERYKLPVENVTVVSSHPIPGGLAMTVRLDGREERYDINFYSATNLGVKLFHTWSLASMGIPWRENEKPILVRVGRHGTYDVDDDDVCAPKFIVDSALFDSLFGSCSKGFICALPDGRVYTLSFALYPDSRCKVTLLCRLEDSVLDVLPLDNGIACYSVCIVSVVGRVMLISSSESQPDHLTFVDIFLASSVICCDSVSDILLHSDGEYIYKTDMSHGSQLYPKPCCGLGAVSHLKIISPLRESKVVVLIITREGRFFDYVVDINSTVESESDLMDVSRSIATCFSRLNDLYRFDDELLRSIRTLSSSTTLKICGKDAFGVNCRFVYPRCLLIINVTKSGDFNLLAPPLILLVVVTWPSHSLDQRLNQLIKCYPLSSDSADDEFEIVRVNLPREALFNFPLEVHISLQSVMEDKFTRLDTQAQVPLAQLCTQRLIVDELHLLLPRDEFQFYDLSTLKRKVWLLAAHERRTFHELFEESPLRLNRHDGRTASVFSLMAVVYGDNELTSLLRSDSHVVIDDTCRVACGDREVHFTTAKNCSGTTLSIHSKHFDVLLKLRRAICRRLKEFPLSQSTLSSVSLPLGIFNAWTELSCALADFHQTNRTTRLFSVYCRLRELISSKFPSASLL